MAARLTELPDTCWIMVDQPTLDRHASHEIRRACVRALDRSFGNVVLDVTGVESVEEDALDLLQAAGEALAARQMCLWLANTRACVVTVVPLITPDLAELAGLSPALDAALAAATQRPQTVGQEGREP